MNVDVVRKVEVFGQRAVVSLVRPDGRDASLIVLQAKISYWINDFMRWQAMPVYPFDPSQVAPNDPIEFRMTDGKVRVLHKSTEAAEAAFKEKERAAFAKQQEAIESRIERLETLDSERARKSIAKYRQSGDPADLLSVNPLDFPQADLHKNKYARIKIWDSEVWEQDGVWQGWAVIQFQLKSGEYERRPSHYIDISEYPALMKYVRAQCYRIDSEQELKGTNRFDYRLPVGLEIVFEDYAKRISIRDVELREAAFQMR